MSSTTDNLIDIPHTLLIGSLNYCLIATWTDISFAVNKCVQFISKSSIMHWEAAKRIVQYLLHTREYNIMYKSEGRELRDMHIT